MPRVDVAAAGSPDQTAQRRADALHPTMLADATVRDELVSKITAALTSFRSGAPQIVNQRQLTGLRDTAAAKPTLQPTAAAVVGGDW